MSAVPIFVVGGVVIATAIIAFVIMKFKSGNGDISSIADDQLIVTELQVSDITDWFKQKNPDGKCTNVTMMVSPETLGSMKFPEESIKVCNDLMGESKNVVLQALFDKEKDNVILTRVVVYDTMAEKLEKLYSENNGVLIIE